MLTSPRCHMGILLAASLFWFVAVGQGSPLPPPEEITEPELPVEPPPTSSTDTSDPCILIYELEKPGGECNDLPECDTEPGNIEGPLPPELVGYCPAGDPGEDVEIWTLSALPGDSLHHNPEPGSLVLAGMGAMAVAGYLWRRRR